VVYAAAGSAADLPCTLNYLPSASGIRVVKAHWSHFAGGHLQNWSILQKQSSRNFPQHLPVVGSGEAARKKTDRFIISLGSYSDKSPSASV